MTHERLREVLIAGMGGKVNMNARETWTVFLQTQAKTYWLNYDWVRDNRFWTKVEITEWLDVGLGGTFGNTVSLREGAT